MCSTITQVYAPFNMHHFDVHVPTQLAIQPYANESVPMYLAVPLLNYLQALSLLE